LGCGVINRDRCGLAIAANQWLRIRRSQQREKNSCEKDKQPQERAGILKSGCSNAFLLHRGNSVEIFRGADSTPADLDQAILLAAAFGLGSNLFCGHYVTII
jgi:DNA-directed RNA polymerase specialized sigma24 family protein